MKLRPARIEDAEAMAAAHARSFDTPWDAGEITALLAASFGYGLVVEAAASGLAGFLLARTVAGEAEILTLCVDPAERRTGVGAALLHAAMIAAAATGAGDIFLEVGVDNAAAIALYENAGFIEAGRRKAYYARSGAARADALVLRAHLNTSPA
jgi:ribosomal-protein-alanine N-acetyltransferase